MVTVGEDMFLPEVISDPYTYYGRLMEEDPVHWNNKYEVWVITRYDDLVWLLRHPEMFSSAVYKNDSRPPYPKIYDSDLGLYEQVRRYQGERFIEYDRPAHLEMRKVVQRYFSPTEIEKWRPLVRSAVKKLLDEVQGHGSMDLMRDFATPLPVLIIAEMMGVPVEERSYVREIGEKLLYITRGEPYRMKPLTKGIQDLIDYVSPMVDERIVNPGDDFISLLAMGEKRGVFTRYQVLVNTALLMLAGHETTINLICNGTLAFIRNPDQWEFLKQDPAGSVKLATEECLRYDSPLKGLPRLALDNVEMRGNVLRRGDRIRWFISSANRDPLKFNFPDKFDITRWPNPHVAFGSGIHHCLGAAMARMEGQEAFSALAGRFDHFELQTDKLEYHPSMSFRSLKSLFVSWK